MSEQIYCNEIAAKVRVQFTVGQDGIVLLYTGTAAYVPSPLQKQLDRYPSGSRVVYVGIEFPQLPEVASGLSGPILDAGVAQHAYNFDVALLHKISDKDIQDIPQLQQALANYLLSKLGAWCDSLKTTPVSGDKWQVHHAAIQGGTFAAAPDLHRRGWWTATVRVGVVATVNRR